MSNGFKKGGRKEANLKSCDKCDCLILPDTDKCIRPKPNKEKNVYESSGDGDESSGEGIVISPKCHETIKIYVKGGPCQEDSHDSETAGETTSRTEPTPQVKISDRAPSSPSKTTQTDEGSTPRKKSICFRFCRKKKPDDKKKGSDIKKSDGKKESDLKKETDTKKEAEVTKPEKCHKDCNTQTCPSGPGKIAEELQGLGDIVKPCPNCKNFGKPGGGCNTNTIIFPRDQSGGDGMTNLENMIRLESKANSRNVEDIMNELHRQRREIHELKDMLDTVMRAVREQLFMTAFGKGKSELICDLNRKNNLERKSNTTSMKSVDEKIEKVKMARSVTPHAALPPPPPPEKKKRRFFPWCK